MPTKADIVATARTYIGTPFVDKGRLKGKACDCVGLPLLVAGELALRDKHDQPLTGQTYCSYTAQPVDDIVLATCVRHLCRRSLTDLQPGDVLVMRLPDTPCHVGIYCGLVDGVPHLVHAYNGAKGCVEHPIDVRWRRRICAAFYFPGVTE